jgi:quercetin dioxygenase-like cupin family protein
MKPYKHKKTTREGPATVTAIPRRATPRPVYHKPTMIAASDHTRHIWGDAASGSVLDRLFLSSEMLHVLEFTLPPGGEFTHSKTNPTIFAADELLYVLDGTLLLRDPTSGETQRATAGEAIFFQRDTWHNGRAGGNEKVRILEFFSPTPATGASSAYAKSQPYLQHVETIDERILGSGWPSGSDKIRADHRMTPVRETDLAWATRGELEIGIFTSTEHLSVIRCHLAAGATSPPEQHPGEEFVLLLSGELVIQTPTAPDANCLFLGCGDAAVLPAETPHSYLSTGNDQAIWLTGVGPGWRTVADIGPSADPAA